MKSLNHKDTKTLINLCLWIFVVSYAPVFAQSSTEADALATFKLATNPTTKLAAAEDFIAKFPNSNARLSIAEAICDEILKIRNGTVALALLERARAVFTSEEEREILKPVALEAYAIGNRVDDAFALAGEMLAKNPDDLAVLMRMTVAGTDEARKKNRKHASVSLDYGLKAIALIEGDKKPASVNDQTWSLQKGNLAQLYQQTAILYVAAGNTQEAKARLTKAGGLSPLDPSNFALLARVINADYLSQMDAYAVMPEGRSKEEALKQLEAVLDLTIDAYARAAGLAIGRAEYQTLLQQVIPDLTIYYKQRHNKSIKGLQQLINRYRPIP
jgi:tetratricopeptide (TPR) repeat protein